MSWQDILKEDLANIRRFKFKLRKQIKKFGNHSKETQSVWSEFMKTKPSEKEQKEFIAFFDEELERNKPPLTPKQKQMKVIAAKQKAAREALGE